MTSSFSFEPSARLQRLLSQELISDPNLAVVELVKNGYDAGARHVRVDLKRIGQACLLIADDGAGMTEQEFRHNWMRPGFSEKARTPGAPVKVGGKNRVPVGEKGLGRLAAGRLGEKLTVYTRKDGEPDWFRLIIKWSKFDDMDEALSRVKFRGQRVADAPEGAFSHGTVLVIEEMSVDLGAKIPGRKSPTRPDTRFGRLAQDLRLLTTSAGGARQDFEIELKIDDPDLAGYAGKFAGKSALDVGQFRYDFVAKPGKDGRLHLQRTVRLGGVTLDEGAIIIDAQGFVGDTAVKGVSVAPHPKDATAGKLTGSFVYAPPAKGQRAPEMPGVFLYRDGVRVEPYGDPDADWVGAYSWKASRQGYASISPKYLYGAVHISRKGNPELIDMSNRQGLIENEAFENLLQIVRAEYRFFGQVVQDHKTTPRWNESQAKKRRDAAQQRAEVSRSQSKSFAHAVRQPLMGIDSELFTLRRIAKDERLPKDLQTDLVNLGNRLQRAASDIGERVDTFLHASDEEVTDFAISDVFADVLDRLEGVINSRGAFVDAAATEARVSFARGVLTEVLVELVSNALAAEDVSGRERAVMLNAASADGEIEIRVVDNGPGLPEARMHKTFERGMTTSGRPGRGLGMQKLNILGAGGDLLLRESDETGTTFVVRLPLSAATLKLETE